MGDFVFKGPSSNVKVKAIPSTDIQKNEVFCACLMVNFLSVIKQLYLLGKEMDQVNILYVSSLSFNFNDYFYQ